MIVTAARGQAEQQGHEVKGSTFPFRAIGKALIEGDPDGFVKIVADAEADSILGMHAIGPHVTELIAEGVFAKLVEGTPQELDERARPSLAGGNRRRPRWLWTEWRSTTEAPQLVRVRATPQRRRCSRIAS